MTARPSELEVAAVEFVWAHRRFLAAYNREVPRKEYDDARARLEQLVPDEGSLDAAQFAREQV